MHFELAIVQGKWAGYRKLITKPGRILIGRDAACDFAIDDPLLSRQHCLLEVSENEAKLTDLKSRNGTYVNGKRIDEEIVKINDEIKLGKHIVYLQNPAKQGVMSSQQICNRCGVPLKAEDILSLKTRGVANAQYCPSCLNQMAPERKNRNWAASTLDTKDRGSAFIEPPRLATGAKLTQSAPLLVHKATKKMVQDEMTMPLSGSLPPGTPGTIGQYQILEMLGEGGMGCVYKAQHTLLDTIVALKVIKEELASHEDILTRFIQEAKLGLTLDHPHIIRIHDAGKSEGLFFITMEYFPGQDIPSRIKTKGSVASPTVLKWAIHMADALSYAHKKGVIHRDVKPSNILVNALDEVKLADFGLAKAWQKAGAHQLTASGQMLGTIQYISPEQLENSKNVDPKTDIFSLGASIYYALAGYPPFGQEPLGQVIQNILNNPPAPLKRQDVPKPFLSVLLKAMAKKVADRYACMEDFKNDLEKIAPECK